MSRGLSNSATPGAALCCESIPPERSKRGARPPAVSCFTPELILADATGAQSPMPTNVCFVGDDLGTLAMASLGGHTLSAVEVAVRGQGLHYP